MIKCSACGAQLPEGAGQCPRCGAATRGEEPSDPDLTRLGSDASPDDEAGATMIGPVVPSDSGSTASYPEQLDPDATSLDLPSGTSEQASSDRSNAWTATQQMNRGEPAVGSVIAGRYEVLSLLGQGGMGAVYKVRDRELDRIIALKTIRPHLVEDPGILERFKRELILARQVTHRNVNRIFDLGDAQGFKFITMEFVEGEELKSCIEREGRMSPDRAVDIIVQICSALEAAHQEGVIHRDLKPQNIMLEPSGRVVVMDFGLARSGDTPGLTQTGMMVGTPHYMSPEQVGGGDIGPPSDLFTVGIIFYELLTGELPYQAETTLSLMIQRTQKSPDPPRKLAPEIPRHINDVVVKCLEIDPELRYQSAREVIDDLVTQRRPSGVTRLSRLTRQISRPGRRRNRVVIALAALLCVLLAAVLWSRLNGPPAAVPVEPTVAMAVLPFQNVSNDPALQWLGAGLAQMLATEVSQLPQVRTILPDRIHQILTDLRVPEDQPPDLATRRRVSEFSNAEVVVWGRFARFGEQIRVDATLQDFKGGRTIPLKAESSKEEDLLVAVSTLAKSISDGLDLKAASRQESIQALKPSTTSVTALRYFNEGVALTREGNDLEALSSFQAAVKADDQFALALSKAGQTQANLGYTNEAIRLSRQAMDLAGSLPARERLEIEATHAQIVGDSDKAADVYNRLLEVSPSDVSIHRQLAELYEAKGNYDLAAEHYAKILEVDPKNLDALYAAGRVEIRRRNYDGSLEFLNAALSLAVQLEKRQARGAVLQAIGIAYKNMNEPNDALRFYRDSLAIREEIGDRRGVASCYAEIGAVTRSLGQLDDAASNYRKALEIQREIGDRSGMSITVNSLSSLEQARGDYEKALALAREALQIQIDLGNENYQALFLSNIGSLYYLQGRYEDALTYHERALQLRQKGGISAEIADTLYNVAETYAMLGQLDKAQDTYLKALELWRGDGDKTGVGFASFGMGQVFEQQGRYGAALAARQEAFDALSSLGEKDVWRIDALAALGHSLSLLGKSREATEHLEKALSMARALGNDTLLARILIYSGDNEFFSGSREDARRHYREALDTATRANNPQLKLLIGLRSARIEIDGGKGASLVKRLVELHREAAARGLRYQSAVALVCLGRATIQARDYTAAKRYLEEALVTGERMALQEILLEAHSALAAVSSVLGDQQSSDLHQRQAQSLLTEMQEETGNEKFAGRADLSWLRETASTPRRPES